ncbi:NADH-quinone oxidoreductase subunit C [Thiorhodococcus mannitoliphagus]|uniref:NADH-quinone oxidoreductase subunit C n=1 Tax=Thiorhodococcus mannitoliphagus TaxID=329406 RepID=A0A6P1E1F1_9GAMM|nr:NADH-quinone oxidoreductase subunit C [Thiorhodococcus mannitoliphagus]NEX22886.1 NADH-quinone oxidoreductase subunit C [Thiorhodococcus mannitoliphagus]
MLDALLPKLAGFEILEQRQRRPDQAFVRVPKAQLFSLLGQLQRQHAFPTLTTIACTDWMEEGVFCLTYVLETAERDRSLGVQVQIGRDGEGIATAIPLWPQAEIFERELHEMFGIPVEGHPSLVDFMLEGWTDIPPMRREFDTLEFVETHYEMRSGREDNQDVREAIRKRKEAKKAEKAALAEKATLAEKTTPTAAKPEPGEGGA